MASRKKRVSIIIQVALVFLVGGLFTAVVSYTLQDNYINGQVREGMVDDARSIAEQVNMILDESMCSDWLIDYWYRHGLEMDIEYESNYSNTTETYKKMTLFSEHQPDINFNYATREELVAMPEEDQKLYAEIAYSFLIMRIDEIKEISETKYLYCVITKAPYDTQYFLFSGARKGEVRGYNPDEIYTLGNFVEVNQEHTDAMVKTIQNGEQIVYVEDYVDYYSYCGMVKDYVVLLGQSYELAGLVQEGHRQSLVLMFNSVAVELMLSIICLLLLYLFVILPIKNINDNIGIYKETKDSKLVNENLSMITSYNELDELAGNFCELTEEIDDYITQIETINEERGRVNMELNMAARLQSHSVPTVFPPFPDRSEFDIYASMTPARSVGGDFYDFLMVEDDYVALLIADVSGKGMPAAMVMVATMIYARDSIDIGMNPARVLEMCNNRLYYRNPEEMFTTMWVGILEVSTGKLVAANAGHEYPIIRHGNGKYEVLKDPHGFVLGGLPDMTYEEYEIQLEPGSRVFLYTDGLPEATNENGEMFGIDRMVEQLNQDPDRTPEQTINDMKEAVDKFVNETDQFDDLTIMCLSYSGTEEKKN